jgi:hypothetical protein
MAVIILPIAVRGWPPASPRIQPPQIRRRRDGLQAVLVVVRIHDAHELYKEGIELDPVVPAVSPDERDRRRGPGLDASGVSPQRPYLGPQLVQQAAILVHSGLQFGPQRIQTLWIDHRGALYAAPCPAATYFMATCQCCVHCNSLP